MQIGNETAPPLCRFLSDDQFQPLYEAFIEAYADYVISFALTETQFRNHINLNAVDLSRTVGCFNNDRIVGFSLNGFGKWNGKSTVYDAGTGVIPKFRRRGIGRRMFEMMLPKFREGGAEQVLLEVVASNRNALELYQKLGFEVVRELALLQRDNKLLINQSPDIVVRPITGAIDWTTLAGWWDGSPSWQNSTDAVDRSRPLKQVLGAYIRDKCAGYIIFSSKFGRVSQICVDPSHRRRGVGTALILAMEREMADGYSMQVINIDKSLVGAMEFFKNVGFYERLAQHEMLLELGPGQ